MITMYKDIVLYWLLEQFIPIIGLIPHGLIPSWKKKISIILVLMIIRILCKNLISILCYANYDAFVIM